VAAIFILKAFKQIIKIFTTQFFISQFCDTIVFMPYYTSVQISASASVFHIGKLFVVLEGLIRNPTFLAESPISPRCLMLQYRGYLAVS